MTQWYLSQFLRPPLLLDLCVALGIQSISDRLTRCGENSIEIPIIIIIIIKIIMVVAVTMKKSNNFLFCINRAGAPHKYPIYCRNPNPLPRISIWCYCCGHQEVAFYSSPFQIKLASSYCSLSLSLSSPLIKGWIFSPQACYLALSARVALSNQFMLT